MDRHDVPGLTAEDLAAAHASDVGVQQNYGVRYLTYWFDEDACSVFCLAEGPNAQAVEDVHREAHGQLASTIIEVEPGSVQKFFGPLPKHPVGEPYVDSAVRAVLFTDICGSTAMTQTLGDDASTALVREHDRIVRAALDAHRGREVKHTGDGIMASFNSVASAVHASIEVQRKLRERNEATHDRFELSIGVAAGEPITDDGDLFGATVQLAARLCAHGEPGRIVTSLAVRELCIGKRIGFNDGGRAELKGFPEPIQFYEVVWD